MNVSERRAEILAVLEETDRETRALFESLSDEDLKTPTTESNWTVGQLAGHVAQAPWAIYVTKRLSSGKDATTPSPLGFLLHAANWWNVRRFRRTSRSELLATWSSAFQKFRDYVDSVPDDVLNNGGEVAGVGKLTAREFLLRSPEHTRQHGEAIRRALRRST